MSKKKKPFKIIKDAPALRAKLGEITGDELKVWMYMWLRTNGEGTAFPGNETMAQELHIYLAGIKKAKKGLREKGWLSSNGQRIRSDGTFSTVLEEVHTPWVEIDTNRGSDSDPAVGRKAAHGTVGRNTDDGIPTQHKEYSETPEVPLSPSAPEDSGRETLKEDSDNNNNRPVVVVVPQPSIESEKPRYGSGIHSGSDSSAR
jgi:hypothetical protein